MKVSEEEHREEMIENALRSDVDPDNEVEVNEAIEENEMLIESLESESSRLTDE